MKKEITNAFKWDLIGKLSTQFSTFFISVLLARLLSPEDYGLLGMAMAFCGFAGSLINLGFGSAIVQAKTINRIEINSVIIINFLIGLFLTAVFYFSSPYIGLFYNNAIISEMVKVISITFIITSISITSVALLERNLRFKSLSLIRLIAGVISGLFGVFLAYNDYGVWSLVYSAIINELLRTTMVIYKVEHRFTLEFSFNSVKKLWSFGSKLFVSGLLEAIYSRIDYLITGKFFPASTLGFYYRSKSLRTLIQKYTSETIGKVLFPVFSKKQDDISWLRTSFEKTYKYILLGSFTLSSYLFLISDELFLILFGKKWFNSIIYFKILIIPMSLMPILALLSNYINALGYSKAFLKFNFFEKIVFLTAIFFSVLYSEFLIFVVAEILTKLIIYFIYSKKVYTLITFKISSFIKFNVVLLLSIGSVVALSYCFSNNFMNNLILSLMLKSTLFLITMISLLKFKIINVDLSFFKKKYKTNEN